MYIEMILGETDLASAKQKKLTYLSVYSCDPSLLQDI